MSVQEKEDKVFTLFIWGANSYGQLGQGHKDDKLLPSSCLLPSSETGRLCQVTGGGGHSILLTDDGHLFVFGWNKSGQLGLPPSPELTLPRPLSGLPKISRVSCGWNHTLAIAEGGGVIVWGANNFGQLGCPEVQAHSHSPVPIPRELFSGVSVVDVAAGLRHSVAATDDGRVFTWGDGRKGQLGHGSEVLGLMRSPRCVDSLCGTACRKVAAGAFHSAAVAEDGRLFCWGLNQHGQCGRGLVMGGSGEGGVGVTSSMRLDERKWITNVYCPLPVSTLPPVETVGCGWSHVLAKTVCGEVFSWGRSDYGQLGREAAQDPSSNQSACSEPQVVPGLKGAKQIACGSEHNLVLSATGQVLAFGWNEHGMCGSGHERNVSTPFHVVSNLAEWEAVSVGAGAGHSFVLARHMQI